MLTNITRQLPGAERMEHRDIREMTVMWRHYRYLRSNPALLPGMAEVQARVSRPARLPDPEATRARRRTLPA